jgi:hypothetical protein
MPIRALTPSDRAHRCALSLAPPSRTVLTLRHKGKREKGRRVTVHSEHMGYTITQSGFLRESKKALEGVLSPMS